jgi:hypothetical protein
MHIIYVILHLYVIRSISMDVKDYRCKRTTVWPLRGLVSYYYQCVLRRGSNFLASPAVSI